MTHKGIKEYQENQRRQDLLNKATQDTELTKKILEWLQSQKDKNEKSNK